MHLTGKALKTIRLGLNLNASDVTIDYGDIDARSAVSEAKLFDNKRVGALPGVGQQATKGCRPKIRIFQPLLHGPV